MSSPTKPLPRTRTLFHATRKRLLGENGNVLLIVVLAMPVIMACAAFAIDVANVWAARQHVQSAADAAALAGAQELGETTPTIDDESSAETWAKKYVDKNLGTDNSAVTRTATAPYNNNPNQVGVTVTQHVPMFFSGLFGLHDATVSATAAAINTPATESSVVVTGDEKTLEQAGVSDASAGGVADGWFNFCASSDSTDSTMSEPGRCPSSGTYASLPLSNNVKHTPESPEFKVIYGGVDVSENFNQYTDGSGTKYPMIDLTGTCVEAQGKYPNGIKGLNGVSATTFTAAQLVGDTTGTNPGSYDGYCAKNADGEIEAAYSTPIPNDTYTFTFEMSENTYGAPTQKVLAVMASNDDFAAPTLPAATTAGAASDDYGTSYPLLSAPPAGVTFREYAVSPDANGSASWKTATFTFKATSPTTYIAIASLTNCEADWNAAATGGKVPNATITEPTENNKFNKPDPQTFDEISPGSGNDCRFGAGVAYDFSMTGPGIGGIALTK